MQNNEITTQSKILKNLKNNKTNLDSIQENVEKIAQSMEHMKSSYESDITNLVLAVNLLKAGHKLEAEDIIAKLKTKK